MFHTIVNFLQGRKPLLDIFSLKLQENANRPPNYIESEICLHLLPSSKHIKLEELHCVNTPDNLQIFSKDS